MRGYVIVLLNLALSPLAWAEYRATPSRIDLGEFTTEAKVAVPALEGCEQDQSTLICRRFSGEFNLQERALLDSAVAGHDPDIQQRRKDQREQDRQAKAARLRAKLGLSPAEFEELREAVR